MPLMPKAHAKPMPRMQKAPKQNQEEVAGTAEESRHQLPRNLPLCTRIEEQNSLPSACLPPLHPLAEQLRLESAAPELLNHVKDFVEKDAAILKDNPLVPLLTLAVLTVGSKANKLVALTC